NDWRARIGLRRAGHEWHYRRPPVRTFLKQQAGYAQAQALLRRKHPQYVHLYGGAGLLGRIYTASKFGVVLQRPIIYHGLFGSGFFQMLYTPQPALLLMFCTSLEYHVLVTLPLLVLAPSIYALLPVALAGLSISLAVCALAAAQAELPRKKQRSWSRPL